MRSIAGLRVLSPEGRCRAYPVGVQLFLLMFYPPKGDTQYLTRGPIDTLSIYCLSERLEHFKNQLGLLTFFPSKCFIPRREIRSISLGVQLIHFPFIVLVNDQSTSKTHSVYRLFFPSKYFIPRREIRSISLGVQLILFPFIVLVNDSSTSKTY